MSAKNRVLSGDYAGKQILGGGVSQAGISIGFIKQLYLNKTTVESYEVINNENQKSMASGVARGIVRWCFIRRCWRNRRGCFCKE